MKKFNANFNVRVNVKSEIQADSIEEARSLIEDEISNAFQVNYLNESDEAIVLSIYAFDPEIDETFEECEIYENDDFNEIEESEIL